MAGFVASSGLAATGAVDALAVRALTRLTAMAPADVRLRHPDQLQRQVRRRPRMANLIGEGERPLVPVGAVGAVGHMCSEVRGGNVGFLAVQACGQGSAPQIRIRTASHAVRVTDGRPRMMVGPAAFDSAERVGGTLGWARAQPSLVLRPRTPAR